MGKTGSGQDLVAQTIGPTNFDPEFGVQIGRADVVGHQILTRILAQTGFPYPPVLTTPFPLPRVPPLPRAHSSSSRRPPPSSDQPATATLCRTGGAVGQRGHWRVKDTCKPTGRKNEQRNRLATENLGKQSLADGSHARLPRVRMCAPGRHNATTRPTSPSTPTHPHCATIAEAQDQLAAGSVGVRKTKVRAYACVKCLTPLTHRFRVDRNI